MIVVLVIVLALLWDLSPSESSSSSEGGLGGNSEASVDSIWETANDVSEALDSVVSGIGEQFIDAWAAAIQKHEGWRAGSVSVRNNNPGNLKYAGQRGSTGADPKGFAIFPDYATGLEALKRQLRVYKRRHPEWSLVQMMSYYLGGDPNNPQVTGEGDPFAYADAIASSIGAEVDSTLGELYG